MFPICCNTIIKLYRDWEKTQDEYQKLNLLQINVIEKILSI